MQRPHRPERPLFHAVQALAPDRAGGGRVGRQRRVARRADGRRDLLERGCGGHGQARPGAGRAARRRRRLHGLGQVAAGRQVDAHRRPAARPGARREGAAAGEKRPEPVLDRRGHGYGYPRLQDSQTDGGDVRGPRVESRLTANRADLVPSSRTTTRGALMKIAVLGIGFMGLPMARRLCQAGYDVQVWNRSREKAARVAEFGATVHDTAASAVRDAQIVICMLENGAVTEDVLFGRGTAQALKRGALVIDMASIKPREARDNAARLADFDVSHLDAPVSGGPGGAEAGTLAIMVGGKAADFQ